MEGDHYGFGHRLLHDCREGAFFRIDNREGSIRGEGVLWHRLTCGAEVVRHTLPAGFFITAEDKADSVREGDASFTGEVQNGFRAEQGGEGRTFVIRRTTGIEPAILNARAPGVYRPC